jgi:hypothetical protein
METTSRSNHCVHSGTIGLDLRTHIFILVIGALISGASACSKQESRPLPQRSNYLFDERPFQISCADRPGPPLPPGRYVVFIGPQAPYARTRLDTLNLPLNEVPALTIAAEPTTSIKIAGASQDHWTLQYCAKGEGNTADEADGYLQKVSMQQTGGLLTLNDTDSHGLTGGQGDLLLTAPAGAPVTVLGRAAVEVHDMAGPVRISAAWARAVVLNTTGRVDASSAIVDFAGSQGSVSLSAPWEINIKLTAQQFRGKLNAHALGQVHAYLPSGFQTPMVIYVSRPKDFVCHGDICSTMKLDRENSLYRFAYGDVANVPAQVSLRSENAQVTLDTTP